MLCFFFQAEDGIRDVAVTGVQTCALPISFQCSHEVGPVLEHTLKPVGEQAVRAVFKDATKETVAHSMVKAAKGGRADAKDRKSTRLNSSHGYISYAVFCLKKKNSKYY